MKQQLVAALAAAVLTISIAQAQTHQEHDTAAGEPATAQAHGAHMTMTDAQFVPMMIQHHRDGIEMARVAEQKATTPHVKQLAANIRANQERELVELQQFQQAAAATTGTAGRDDQHAVMMMRMSKQSIERVQSANGKEVDRAFLKEMSSHHQMAIDMVSMTKFQDAKLKQSANKMAGGQRREIQELKATQQKIG